MKSPIIKVTSVSKKYNLGTKKPYDTLRDSVSEKLSNIFKPKEQEVFWALRDISFTLGNGEMLGVIGGNGAGKSTLLKVLSRITPPTRGEIEIGGRIASLLEVGTGFHPELSGRENIYFNGSLLGMSRIEINHKFNDIVDFAGISKFIDVPVKRYSSGMYVRLAFSVAAHLESEILLIDEVLAVGDYEFQKKCIGKMGDISGKQGRSIIFVSHNMSLVSKLCKRSIFLDSGKIIYSGETDKVINKYLNSKINKNMSLKNRKDRIGSGEVKIKKIYIIDESGKVVSNINTKGRCSFVLEYESITIIKSLLVGFIIRNSQGTPIFIQHNRLYGKTFDIQTGSGKFTCQFKDFPVLPGNYFLTYSLMPHLGKGGEYVDSIENAFSFVVKDNGFYPTWELPNNEHGLILSEAKWNISHDT